MVLKFGDIELQGPFSFLEELEDRQGVFTVLCLTGSKIELRQVRTAKFVQTEVAELIAQRDWSDLCAGKLRIAAFYTDDELELEAVRQEILCAELRPVEQDKD